MLERAGCRLLVAGLLVLAAALAAGCSSDGSRSADSGSNVVWLQQGDYVYLYHVITGTEGLYDVSRDPRQLTNLAPELPDLARSLRRSLEKKLGLADLSELRDEDDRALNALRGLGYI